ncbi:MAG: hypothetical protein HRU15_15255, partial [Planctomycetes bacterium]|nr:hypothetical protein [Planctomycetota bacterium]
DALFGDLDNSNTGMWRAITSGSTDTIRRKSTDGHALEKNVSVDGTEVTSNGQLEEVCSGIKKGSIIDLEAECMNFERQMVRAALELTDHNLTEAAKKLGISFRQMRYKVKTLGLR